MTDMLAIARDQVLERGVGLDEAQVLVVLQLPDERLEEAHLCSYFFGIGIVAVPVAWSFGQIRIRLPPGVFCVMT